MATVHDQLLAALDKIDRPGSFAVSGSEPAVLPGLEVQGFGPVGLPLNAAQAKELIKQCEQAPYGKGEQTLVDTDVRRVWRMKPDRFSLTNPQWADTLGRIVSEVQQGLGLEGQGLEAHLYDLLLYEPGGFFLPHQDGEKLPRMVATLVVALPSTFAGGEIVVRHDGREQAIDLAGGDQFQIRYAAFYADCEHEIRPLREGYRLCLVYNLTLTKSQKKPLGAPRTSEHVAPVRDILAAWATEETPRKLAVTLDHEYTQEGLVWDALKGVDRARADVLAEAARQAGCQAHLAQLTFYESGQGEDDYEYGWRSRRRRYEDEDSGNHTMVEVYDTSLKAAHWSDTEGNRLDIGEMDVEKGEVLDGEALQEVTPQENYQGFTGNEGATLQRWYRHAAIFLWPDARHFEILCTVGSQNVSHALQLMVAGWRKAGTKQADAMKAQCVAFARTIMAKWAPREIYWRQEKSEPCALLASLDRLDDAGLIRQYLRDVLAKDASLEPGAALVAICQRHGAAFQAELEAVLRASTRRSIERNVRLFESLCLAKPRKKAGWAAMRAALGDACVTAFEQFDQQKSETDYSHRELKRDELLAGLARALLATGQERLLRRVVDHALAHPEAYPLPAHVAALTALGPWLAKNVASPSPALARWLAGGCRQLAALTAKEPQPPSDFRRASALRCKCHDCAALARFLDDPKEREYRFRARQDKRSHLESSISSGRCEVDCTTETRGSPHTLVCTKNTAHYQAALKKYHEDQQHLAGLRAIEAALPG